MMRQNAGGRGSRKRTGRGPADYRKGTRKPIGKPGDRREAAKAEPKEEPFRVLMAIHRPRYRSRAERAVAIPGWEVRSLLNREDPIGLINQKAPDLLMLSVDTARNIHTGYLRAAQRYRGTGMRIVVLGETDEDVEVAGEECDAALSPPWRSVDLRAIAARLYEGIRGEALVIPDAEDATEEE